MIILRKKSFIYILNKTLFIVIITTKPSLSYNLISIQNRYLSCNLVWFTGWYFLIFSIFIKFSPFVLVFVSRSTNLYNILFICLSWTSQF